MYYLNDEIFKTNFLDKQKKRNFPIFGNVKMSISLSIYNIATIRSMASRVFSLVIHDPQIQSKYFFLYQE